LFRECGTALKTNIERRTAQNTPLYPHLATELCRSRVRPYRCIWGIAKKEIAAAKGAEEETKLGSRCHAGTLEARVTPMSEGQKHVVGPWEAAPMSVSMRRGTSENMNSQTAFADHQGRELATGIACSMRDVCLIAQHPGIALWEMCVDRLQPLLCTSIPPPLCQ